MTQGRKKGWGLAAFDLDSTLIAAEGVDELAAVAGVGAQVAAITARAIAGELDFALSLTERAALLAGLPEAALHEVAARLPLQEGAERLLAGLKRLGCKTAILSGGFDWLARSVQRRLDIDHVHANRLEIRDGRLTGKVIPPILDAAAKARLLRRLARQEGIPLAQTIAVGDGPNDMAMLEAAGMGIAFRAGPLVRQAAQHALAADQGLDAILPLMGVGDGSLQSI